MAWFFVDDGFYDHPKLAALPPARRMAAIGLWTLAGAWSRRKLTGGHIPAGQVRLLGGTSASAKALVTSGLWRETEQGYEFHDWSVWQETPAEVAAKRARDRTRQSAWRKANSGMSQRDSAVSHSAVTAPVTPSVTAQSRACHWERERERDPGSEELDQDSKKPHGVSTAEQPTIRTTTFLVRTGFEKRFLAARGGPPSWSPRAAESAAVVASWVDTHPDGERALERALDGFFADPWAQSKGFPLGALANDPMRYANPPEAKASDELSVARQKRDRLAAQVEGLFGKKRDSEAMELIHSELAPLNERIRELEAR